MRVLGLVMVGVALAGAFFLGRLSRPSPAAAAARHHGSVFIAAHGDVIRIPGVATRCTVETEARRPELLCDHTPRGRFKLALFRDTLFVYRNGDPEKPRFTARWKP